MHSNEFTTAGTDKNRYATAGRSPHATPPPSPPPTHGKVQLTSTFLGRPPVKRWGVAGSLRGGVGTPFQMSLCVNVQTILSWGLIEVTRGNDLRAFKVCFLKTDHLRQNESRTRSFAVVLFFSTADIFQRGLCAATSHSISDMKAESTLVHLTVYLADFPATKVAERLSPTLL